MNITVKEIDQVLVVQPMEKRLDAAIAPAFKGQMVDYINQGHSKLVLNLAEVEFVDSSGLTALTMTDFSWSARKREQSNTDKMR